MADTARDVNCPTTIVDFFSRSADCLVLVIGVEHLTFVRPNVMEELFFDSDVVLSTVQSLKLVGGRFIPGPYPLQSSWLLTLFMLSI